MSDTTVGSQAPRQRRRWLRAVAWIVGTFVVLLVVVYFVATSSSFFKGVILPRVSKALNAQVTVTDASISPFKQVILRNLKVQTTGTEPLVSATEVRLRYSLMDMLGGKIHVDEVTLAAPTVTLNENPDGTSNLDPILKALEAKPAEEKPAPAPRALEAKPLQVDVRKVALTDATVRQVKHYANGTRDVVELSQVNVTLEGLKNSQTGKLAVSANIRVENTNALLLAKLGGNFTYALTADLKPASVKGNTRLDVTRAEGALGDMASFSSDLNADVTPTDIKEVALRFQKGNARLGELRVSGPFDMAKTEGRLSIVLAGIDRQLLNLAGAGSGMDFGGTTIGSTNDIELAKGGSLVTVNGQADLSNFQVTRTNQTTPRLDLRKDYSLTVDLGQSLATLRRLTLTGTQNGKPLLKGDLTSPMQIAWGSVSNALGDAALTLAVSGLDLADWKPFLGEVAPAGLANLTAKVLSQQGGRQVTLDLDSRIERLTVNAGSNHISDATITMRASAKATGLKQFHIADSKLEVSRQNDVLTTLSGSGTYDTAAETADMQFTAQAALAPLLRALPQPDMSVASGKVDLKAHLTQKQKTQTVTGNLALADFTGQYGLNELRGFGLTADLDLSMTPQQVQIRKVAGKLTQGMNPGGSFDLTGTYDTVKKTADVRAKLTDFNQNGVGPFLQAALADKKLVSVAINANAKAQFDPEGTSALNADLQMTNLVVKDPKNQFPATPLEAKMTVDASLRKQVADVRQCQLTLTPTARAANQVQLTGQVDMSQTNAIQGSLKLAADSLDFTSYYDLFIGEQTRTPGATSSSTQTTPAAAAATAAADANKEPDAIQLPFRNFTAEAVVRRLYLHEIEIADWQATTKLDGGRVVINPFKLTLNGAPVNSVLDLDLGVPGWKYDVSLSAQAIPLAPLVNSFQPERNGILSGTMTAQAKVAGAGTTGAGLQKHLTGQFDMASTNLNLSVDNIEGKTFYTRLLKTVVKAITVIPELVKSPTATVGSLLQGLTTSTSSTSSRGGAADLAKSPINAIILNGTTGSGRVNLQKVLVQSPAFEAQASGTITLAEVLTNSAIQIPVSVSLERSVAQRINLAGDTPTNAAYAKLPDFLTMKGTLGNSKADINKIALTSAVLQGVGGKTSQVGGALQGLSSLLSGGTNAASSAAGTNEPSNKTGGLLQGLGGILGTTPSTATNAADSNAAPVDSLIRGLFRPKKK